MFSSFIFTLMAPYLLLHSSIANTQCERRADGSVCHKYLAGFALPFLPNIAKMHMRQHTLALDDTGWFYSASGEYLAMCNFDGAVGRINPKYRSVTNKLSPINKKTETFPGIRKWPHLLHAAQNFYSRTNWLDIQINALVGQGAIVNSVSICSYRKEFSL